MRYIKNGLTGNNKKDGACAELQIHRSPESDKRFGIFIYNFIGEVIKLKKLVLFAALSAALCMTTALFVSCGGNDNQDEGTKAYTGDGAGGSGAEIGGAGPGMGNTPVG